VKFVQVEFEIDFIDLFDIKLFLQDLDQILETWGREQQNNTTDIMDPLQILLDLLGLFLAQNFEKIVKKEKAFFGQIVRLETNILYWIKKSLSCPWIPLKRIARIYMILIRILFTFDKADIRQTDIGGLYNATAEGNMLDE
jgi:hypothetical protein